MASLDERAMATDKRLVRAAFGCFGLSGNGMAFKKARRCHGDRLCSTGRGGFLFRGGESCLGNWKLIRRSFLGEKFELSGTL